MKMDASAAPLRIFEEATPSFKNSRVSKPAAFGGLDMPTGILNRGMIECHLQESLAIHGKYPAPFCVMCIAVDDLPTVRERFGQAAVDAAMRAAAQTIQDGIRPTDHVGRWNENELLAILTECNENRS
jgi:diguanylate cyclase (GGDEF)-like protein